MNQHPTELYLAVYTLTVNCTIRGNKHKLKTELVAESQLEAIETFRNFLIKKGAKQFSFHCRQLYSLLWSFVTE